jgi:hypothetical protein
MAEQRFYPMNFLFLIFLSDVIFLVYQYLGSGSISLCCTIECFKITIRISIQQFEFHITFSNGFSPLEKFKILKKNLKNENMEDKK